MGAWGSGLWGNLVRSETDVAPGPGPCERDRILSPTKWGQTPKFQDVDIPLVWCLDFAFLPHISAAKSTARRLHAPCTDIMLSAGPLDRTNFIVV